MDAAISTLKAVSGRLRAQPLPPRPTREIIVECVLVGRSPAGGAEEGGAWTWDPGMGFGLRKDQAGHSKAAGMNVCVKCLTRPGGQGRGSYFEALLWEGTAETSPFLFRSQAFWAQGWRWSASIQTTGLPRAAPMPCVGATERPSQQGQAPVALAGWGAKADMKTIPVNSAVGSPCGLLPTALASW